MGGGVDKGFCRTGNDIVYFQQAQGKGRYLLEIIKADI